MKPIEIGKVALGDAPRIAVPLYDADPTGDVARVRGHAHLVELRIDCFADVTEKHVCGVIGRMRDAGSPPIIATIRWVDEGGKAKLSDEQRAALYAAVLPLVDAVDIELHSPLRDRVIENAREHGKTTIASFHDFQAMPPFYDIEGLVDEADTAGADILKIAAVASSIADVRHLLEFTLRHRDRGVVTIALGDIGAVSRVVFPLAGSLFTFAYLHTPSGPGQLPLLDLHAELHRYFPQP